MDNTEEFRCISLCSGYAGLELGLRRVIPNLRTVAYVEREGFACANLVAKIEAGKLDAAPIWTDIKTFDGRPFHKRVHIITSGYPCQPFSVAGKRQGTDDPRHLWPYIARIVQAVRPVWCFFENVSGHLSIGFPEVYRSLRNMGYKVEAGLFTAEEVGAPHKRERLFILAYAEGNRPSIQRQSNRNQKRNIQNIESEKQSILRSKIKRSNICLRESELVDTETAQRRRLPEEYTGRGIEEVGRPNGMWPSRPGQPQYEWEEPRVVGECSSKRLEGQAGTKLQRISNRPARASEGQAQSRLGRKSDGNPIALDTNRVDRLRLLGNGVIPAQAELAFKVLYEKQIQTAKS